MGDLENGSSQKSCWSLPASHPHSLKSAALFAMPNLIWWTRPVVGSGFTSSTRRELMSLAYCRKKKHTRFSRSFTLILIQRASWRAQDGSDILILHLPSIHVQCFIILMRKNKNYTPVPGMKYNTSDDCSELWGYLSYGQCPVPRFLDKGGLSVS